MSSLSSALANAFAANEGYGISGAVPTISNNPGDLENGDVGYGTTGLITNYGSPQSGWDALKAKFQNILSGGSTTYPLSMTAGQMVNTYTNNGPNAVSNILGPLGIDPSEDIRQMAGAANSLSTGTSGSALSNAWNGLTNFIQNGGNITNAPGGVGSVAAFIKKITGAPQFTLTNIVFVVLGLILIIAGVFSFDKVQSTIVSVAKSGAKAAEVAAA
jgi:hypothetical protein